MTSHDVVDVVRRALGTRRVGHMGTLDPQATGVLPLAVREATKLVNYVGNTDKSYVGSICLGAETDTLDAEGRILRRHDGPLPDEAAVVAALKGFVGDIEQIPPMYSAVKKGGVPLHKLARQGEEVERDAKKVRIDRLDLLRFESPRVEIRVDCTAGTYVRTLAADLGRTLGCGAYLEQLRRHRSGPFGLDIAVPLAEVEQRGEEAREFLIPPAKGLGLAIYPLSPEAERRVRHGADVAPGTVLRAAPGDRVLAVDSAGEAVALLELRADRRLWPLRVLQGMN
jgi:tRNA pseudouridine55 synthase